ncbi:MAG: ATP synthase F1 subunit epsilon [Myxococcaceae bacterium]|nr:ATP synthase F1 subunit epsilon [Myxococcaceae bacterium]
MAGKLKVEVVSPAKRLVSQDADEVIAPGADGLFGVRAGHTPYLALLQAGPLTIIDGATTQKFFVAGGFAEAGPQHVRVLAESAEPLEGIDVAAAKKRLADEQKKLDGISPTAPEYAAQAQRVKVEARRVEVAEKK